MKKILYFLILISIYSSNDESIENNQNSSNDNCYNVILVGNSTPFKQCDVNLVIGLVRHSDFEKGGPFNPNITTYV